MWLTPIFWLIPIFFEFNSIKFVIGLLLLCLTIFWRGTGGGGKFLGQNFEFGVGDK